MLSLKKISRHIPRKILYPSVTENRICPLSNQRLASSKLRFSLLHPLIFIELYLSIFPHPLFSSPFFSSPFLFYPHTSFIDIFPRKDKIRAKGYTRFAVYISRFFLFHQLRTAVGGEVSLVSPLLREKEFECISTFPWNVLHLQLLFLNLFSRHLCPKFYGMCSNCISFFILFSFKLYTCEVVRFVNCIFWCINK